MPIVQYVECSIRDYFNHTDNLAKVLDNVAFKSYTIDMKNEAKRITYGYDRHERSWCIIVVDDEGNEIESAYVGALSSCLFLIDRYKDEYNIDEVVKYKAY